MTPIVGEPDGATPLDPDEIEGLKYRHVTTRGQLDQLEQANVQAGLRWLARRRKVDVLTDEFVRELHRRLFGDVWRWAGKFRLTLKSIGVEPFRISTELRQLLGDARYWHERRTLAPLEAAARFHHRLVWIHPFPNGNGRHARIAADIYLEQCFDAPPIDWAAGHNLQINNERRKLYLAALRAADGHDFDPLLAFVGHRP